MDGSAVLPGGLRYLFAGEVVGGVCLLSPNPLQPSLAQPTPVVCAGLCAYRRMEKTFTFSQVLCGTSLLLSPAYLIIWKLSLTAPPAISLFQSG